MMAAARWLSLPVAVAKGQPVLLDTCILIDAYERRPTPVDNVPFPLRRTTVVAAHEFLRSKAGLLPDHKERKYWLDGKGIMAVGFRREAADAFRVLTGSVRGPRGLADALIAAESLDRKWPLVTGNDKDFDQVPGLMLVDWRVGRTR